MMDNRILISDCSWMPAACSVGRWRQTPLTCAGSETGHCCACSLPAEARSEGTWPDLLAAVVCSIRSKSWRQHAHLSLLDDLLVLVLQLREAIFALLYGARDVLRST